MSFHAFDTKGIGFFFPISVFFSGLGSALGFKLEVPAWNLGHFVRISEFSRFSQHSVEALIPKISSYKLQVAGLRVYATELVFD